MARRDGTARTQDAKDAEIRGTKEALPSFGIAKVQSCIPSRIACDLEWYVGSGHLRQRIAAEATRCRPSLKWSDSFASSQKSYVYGRSASVFLRFWLPKKVRGGRSEGAMGYFDRASAYRSLNLAPACLRQLPFAEPQYLM